MGELKLSSAQSSNLTDAVSDVTIDSKQIDGAMDQDETFWENTNASKYWGIFNSQPDLKSALLMKSIWTLGKGYDCDNYNKSILDHLQGWAPCDNFEDIMFNLDVNRRIFGDAYAEILKDDKTGKLIKLKVLNPIGMRHVVDKKGNLIRFEQTSKTVGGKPKTWTPEEIFYIPNNRLADQIHGISDIEALEKTILADNESFVDTKRIMHTQARPMILFKLGTDDPAKIQAFVDKMDKAIAKGENVYIPNDKDAVDFEVVQVNPSNLVFEWRNDIRNKFYRAIGLPQIVPGGGGQSTESESKVIYLAFEQLVENDQRFLERQIWNQLNLKVEFTPPATLSQDLQNDESKDAGQQLGFMPSEVSIGAGQYA